MAKVIKQFRYFANNADLTNIELDEGTTIWKAPTDRIISLGIQALPGTKIFINETEQNDKNTKPLIIGNSGIYQIDVEDELTINSLSVDLASYANLLNAGIIFDIIYETEDNS